MKTRNQGATPWSEDVDVSTRSLRPARARSSRAAATSAIVALANALSALGGSQPSRPAISTTSWLTVIELRCRSLRKRLSSFTDPIGNSALAATCHRTSSRTESATGPASIVTRAPGSGEPVGRIRGLVSHNRYGGQLARVGKEARPPLDRERATPSAVEQNGGIQRDSEGDRPPPRRGAAPPRTRRPLRSR